MISSMSSEPKAKRDPRQPRVAPVRLRWGIPAREAIKIWIASSATSHATWVASSLDWEISRTDIRQKSHRFFA